MTYTWTQFLAAVKSFVTDRTPADTNFVAAATEYVRARIARDILGDANGYALTEKRYTAMRRGLAGYSYSANDATLQAAVRVQLSEGARTNAQVAQAIALYIRAETAREIDARGGNITPEGALAVSKACRADYQQLRIRLCGFAHTLAGTLTAEVAKYLPVDASRVNSTTYLATLQAAAVEDIEAFGTWLNGQIATAKDDLQALSDRVTKEIEAGTRDLLHFARAYQKGHEDTFQEADVTAEGLASLGTIPDQAQFREAFIKYPSATDEDDDIDDAVEERCNERPCSLVPWSERSEKLICTNECVERITIDPKGGTFLVHPALVDGEIELRVVYDGMKIEWSGSDNTPFDDDAVRVVGMWVNRELSGEWGESASQQALWASRHASERTKAYLKHKSRAAVEA